MNTKTNQQKSVYLVTYTAQAFQSAIHGVFSIHETLYGAFNKMNNTANDLVKGGQFTDIQKIDNKIKLIRNMDDSEIVLYVEQRILQN